jgi:hypothetical protein
MVDTLQQFGRILRQSSDDKNNKCKGIGVIMNNKATTKGWRKWLRIAKSTGAAFFGVQSSKVLEEDFQGSSPLPFIVMGLILAVCFIISLVTVVNIVLD